ncbi:hypothetical protein Sar04_38810 [Salinispora arenicola]|uniref:Uncharacterized protein n=1 Tax=Salinispora arenicola TaxID=168697 RepID=A0ABQ4JW31_SALAC|nr:hypothetical protein Sar04_38810 [Salinispora arenicola]
MRKVPPGTSRKTTPDGMCRQAGRSVTISSVHMAPNANSPGTTNRNVWYEYKHWVDARVMGTM